MRFHVGHVLGRKSQFAHYEARHLDPKWANPAPSAPRWRLLLQTLSRQKRPLTDHDRWVSKQEHTEKVSSEAFIAHFSANYGNPLPVWTATEVMSFGTLNRLWSGMKQADRLEIAASFDVFHENGTGDGSTFASWLEHLRQTRNYCAHHSRLWNRNHTAPLAVPFSAPELEHLKGAKVGPGQTSVLSHSATRIYASLALLSYMSVRIDGTNDNRDRLLALVTGFGAGKSYGLDPMGFPEGWADLDIWKSGYGRNATWAKRAGLLSGVVLLPTGEAAQLLTHKAEPKGREARLKYYLKNGAALSVPSLLSSPTTTQDAPHRYPAFQFDEETGDLRSDVIIANRRLLGGKRGSEQERWDAFEWWTTPNAAWGGMSPRQALEKGPLDPALLDRQLSPPSDEHPSIAHR